MQTWPVPQSLASIHLGDEKKIEVWGTIAKLHAAAISR